MSVTAERVNQCQAEQGGQGVPPARMSHAGFAFHTGPRVLSHSGSHSLAGGEGRLNKPGRMKSPGVLLLGVRDQYNAGKT